MSEMACNQTQPDYVKLKNGPTKWRGLGFFYDAQNDLLETNLLVQRDFDVAWPPTASTEPSSPDVGKIYEQPNSPLEIVPVYSVSAFSIYICKLNSKTWYFRGFQIRSPACKPIEYLGS